MKLQKFMQFGIRVHFSLEGEEWARSHGKWGYDWVAEETQSAFSLPGLGIISVQLSPGLGYS